MYICICVLMCGNASICMISACVRERQRMYVCARVTQGKRKSKGEQLTVRESEAGRETEREREGEKRRGRE